MPSSLGELNEKAMKIYVFDNEKLTGDNFSAALIDEHEAETDQECLEWFEAQYDINDYTASFTAP